MICSLTARSVRHTPSRFTLSVRSTCSTGELASAPVKAIPAFAIATSIAPKRWTVARTARCSASKSVTSTSNQAARSPRCAAFSSRRSGSSPTSATFAPLACRRSALAAPMPRAAPVISAVRPLTSNAAPLLMSGSSYAFALRASSARHGRRAVAPVGREHRVHGVVVEAAGNPHRLAQHALGGEAEALGERAAASVLDVQANLDAVQPPLGEGVIDDRVHGLGHRARALRSLIQPVADTGRPVGPVDAVEADHPHDPPALDDRRLKALFRGLLRVCPRDELARLRARLRLRPREPAREVRAVRLDQDVQLLGVAGFDRAQLATTGELEARHGRTISRASGSERGWGASALQQHGAG